VTAGLLVATRVAQASPGGGAGPVEVRSLDGVPPHVVYTPDSVESSNDAAPNDSCYAGMMNLMGTFDVPPTLGGRFWNSSHPFYQIDLGTPFCPPWPGTIRLAGGRQVGESRPIFQYQQRRTSSPSRLLRVVEWAQELLYLVSLGAVPKVMAQIDAPMDFTMRPLFDPTFTFVDLPDTLTIATAPQVPLGTWAVQVPTVQSVTFNVYGVDYPVVIAPSQPIPIGFLAMGTVRATAGNGPIPLLACHLKLG
jgi:hypothetical protein